MRGHGERQEVGQGRQLELGVREVLLEPLGRRKPRLVVHGHELGVGQAQAGELAHGLGLGGREQESLPAAGRRRRPAWHTRDTGHGSGRTDYGVSVCGVGAIARPQGPCACRAAAPCALAPGPPVAFPFSGIRARGFCHTHSELLKLRRRGVGCRDWPLQ